MPVTPGGTDSSGAVRLRINVLEKTYRLAFSNWVSARNLLTPAHTEVPVHQRVADAEALAAGAYRSARNDLAEGMAILSSPQQQPPPPRLPSVSRRGWLWDFGLICFLILLTLAVANFLAGLASGPR